MNKASATITKVHIILRIATATFHLLVFISGHHNKLSAILRDAMPRLTYSIERSTTMTSLKLSGSALETDSVADDDAAASIPP